MTIPNDIIYPFNPSDILTDDPKKLAKNVQDLVYTLSRVYQDTAQAINGEVFLFEPRVLGSTSDGSATYTTRFGWAYRQGLFIDIWMDIAYSGHTGTGNTLIQIPYKVSQTAGFPTDLSTASPFVGTCENVSGVTLNGGRTYMVSRALPETFTIAIDEAGSGVVSQQFPLASSGQFRVHNRFLGDFIEP